MLLNVNEIKEYLPQRYPFLLVDRVVEMEMGRWLSVVLRCLHLSTHPHQLHPVPSAKLYVLKLIKSNMVLLVDRLPMLMLMGRQLFGAPAHNGNSRRWVNPGNVQPGHQCS